MAEGFVELPGGSLDVTNGLILRNGQPVKIEPRAWRVLEQLVRFRHRVVTKQELLAVLRADGAASDSALRQAISAARLAIGATANSPVIRSIRRVGYILDLPRGHARLPLATPARAQEPASLFIAPLRNDSGFHSLQWIEFGLVACITHGLALDGRIHVRDATELELHTTRAHQHVKKLLRALDARYGVTGSVRLHGREIELSLQIYSGDSHSTFAICGSTAAELVAPAIEALRSRVIRTAEPLEAVAALLNCSPMSIELFARAKHAAAEHRHAAALRALELLHHIEPGFPGLELELLRGQAICGAPQGEVLAERLLHAARRDADIALEARTRLSLGSLEVARGRQREAAQNFQQALSIGRGCMPPDWQAHTLVLLAATQCRLAEMHSVQSHLDEAQQIFMRSSCHHGMLKVLWVRAVMSSLSGNVAQAILWNKKLASSARRLHANTSLLGATFNLAFDLLHIDRLEEAQAFAEEARSTALAVESSTDLAFAIANLGCLLYRLQRRPEAAEALLKQLPHPANVADPGFLWQAHGHAAMANSRFGEAAACFLKAATEHRCCGNRIAEPPMLPWLVEALVRSGRTQAAQAELDRAASQPHLQDESTAANLLYPRALLARARGLQPEALRLFEQLASAPAALPLFRRLGHELSSAPPELFESARTPALPPNAAMRRQYRFANCMLDIERREFWIDGRPMTLAPKPYDVLVHLYRNRHRVVPQEELLCTCWSESSGSPEVVAQAITKIRQVLRSSNAPAGLIQTIYGKGYQLTAHARAEPDEDATAALELWERSAPHERLLAWVSLPATEGKSVGADPDTEDRQGLIAGSLAVNSGMRQMSAAEIRACTARLENPTAEAMVAAIRGRHLGASILFAKLEHRDPMLTLRYLLVSSWGRSEGSLIGPSPTGLGRNLSTKLRQHEASADAQSEAADVDRWLTQMFELASLAAEQRCWDRAAKILEVILDNAPGHEPAAELQAHVRKNMATG